MEGAIRPDSFAALSGACIGGVQKLVISTSGSKHYISYRLLAMQWPKPGLRAAQNPAHNELRVEGHETPPS